MTSLPDFLLAMIAADEVVAKAAIGQNDSGVWSWSDEYNSESCIVEGDAIRIYDEGGHDMHQAQHIARHDPARVLADCASKRQIVELVVARCREVLMSPDGDPILRNMAQPHADHEDFESGWVL